MKILIKYEDNWADETDLNGFAIVELEIWDATTKKLEEKAEFPLSWYSGTNEEQIWDSKEDFLRRFILS